MNASDSLPTKAKELRALLLAERALHAQERARHSEELSTERKAKDHAQDEMKRLMGIIKELQRNRFGRSSERLDVDQLMLAFEEVEQAIAAAQAAAEDLAEAGDVVLAFCWSHSRRKFYDIQVATPAPIAAEALMRIATLYSIEDDIRGRSAEERKQARQQRSKPLVEALHVWLQDKLKTVSAKSTIAEAIRYSLSRWEGLSRFLDDGRIEIDSNVVERGMRTIALGRKNHLFAGSDYGGEHWAVLASLIETCKMNGVDPQAYLRDVLAKIVARHPMSRIDELLPFAYRPMQAEKAAA